MAYVIRSMSTTDARPGVKPEPYHVFLLPRHERAGAWWGSAHRAWVFATLEEAEAEWNRCGFGQKLGTHDIAPTVGAMPIWVAKHHVPAQA